MSTSFVGTPALATAASSNSMSVAGTWGAGQNRTAGHLLVAVISSFGPTSVTLGAAPAGWTLARSEPSGATTITATYTLIATGADAAPTFTATTVGGAGSSTLTCVLFECSDTSGQTPSILSSGVAQDTVSSSLSPAASALAGNVAISFAATGGNGSNAATSWTTPTNWTLVTAQTASLPCQVGVYQDATPPAGALSVTLSWTRTTTQTSAQLLVIGVVTFSGSATATLTLGTAATGLQGFKGAVTATLTLGTSATGGAINSGAATATLTLVPAAIGQVVNPGYIATFVFFYTGTTTQFEIDEVIPTSVLYSFLQSGFIVTSLTPTSTGMPDGTDIYIFTLQRYALPPQQPALIDPP